MSPMSDCDRPRVRLVDHLPDLMTIEDYATPERKKVRVQIMFTDQGVEILGDSMYPVLLEEMLARLGAKEIERTLCG